MDSPAPDPSIIAAVKRAILERLADGGEILPDGVRASLLSLDRRVSIPALVEILESDALADIDAPGSGYEPIHAVALLQELGATEAIEPLLRVLARRDPRELLSSDLVLALEALGPPVLEPALAAHARAETDPQRRCFEEVLSGLGVRDERILAILRKVLGRNLDFGAGLLALYGDPAALPDLVAALDGCEVSAEGRANGTIIELAGAMEKLGGALTADQQRKLSGARAALRAELLPARRAGASGDDEDEDEPGDDQFDDELDDEAEERDRILERFEASPHAADASAPDWIGRMLSYAAQYQGTPFADLDGAALHEIVFEIFPRKVTCAPAVATEAVRSLRAFWTFARDVLAHPHAEECLEVLGEGAEARFERELADPSNYGLAKSMFMSVAGPGLPGGLVGDSRRPAGSRSERKQKKKLRKQRKQAQRRNRR